MDNSVLVIINQSGNKPLMCWSDLKCRYMRLLTSASRKATLSSRSLMTRSLSWMTVLEFCSCIYDKTNKHKQIMQCLGKPWLIFPTGADAASLIHYKWVSSHSTFPLGSTPSDQLRFMYLSPGNLIFLLMASCAFVSSRESTCIMCVRVCTFIYYSTCNLVCTHLFDHVANFPLLTL